MVEKSRIKGTLIQAMLYLKKLNLCYFLLNTRSVVLFFVYSVAMGRMFKLVILCGDKSRGILSSHGDSINKNKNEKI